MPLRKTPHPRYLIKTLSRELRKLSFPTSPISPKLAIFAADAFDKFLTGNSPSLDAAFGLRKKRGIPGWPKARLKMAKEVFALRKAQKSWSKVQQTLAERGYKDTDLGTIKRTYKEFRIHLMARSVWTDLESELLQTAK